MKIGQITHVYPNHRNFDILIDGDIKEFAINTLDEKKVKDWLLGDQVKIEEIEVDHTWNFTITNGHDKVNATDSEIYHYKK
ncbi:hypothetical protein [uncultured Kordia sp.]|uniref:hypothetical protein n=1 Tax=uncultured Kordia sp. TaxID=507699 RepID=UPI00260F9F20|nr:hypothetical protein [uncultured Kordia sp.]